MWPGSISANNRANSSRVPVDEYANGLSQPADAGLAHHEMRNFWISRAVM